MAQMHTYEGIVCKVLENVGLGLLALLIHAVSFYYYTIQAKKGCANLQETILSKSLKLPYDYYETTHSGDFMSKLMYDCSRTEDVYGSRFRRILMPCLMVLWYLVPMFLLSWQVTACLVGICIITFIINALYIRPMENVSAQLSKTHTSLTKRLTDLLSGMDLVKAFSIDGQMVKEYTRENEKFRQGQKKQNRLSASLEAIFRLWRVA